MDETNRAQALHVAFLLGFSATRLNLGERGLAAYSDPELAAAQLAGIDAYQRDEQGLLERATRAAQEYVRCVMED